MNKQQNIPMEQSLLTGEVGIKNAPLIRLSNGNLCVPQHYLSYSHNLESVEKIVLDIEYDPRYVIFVCQESGQVYLQVGIIGPDNYKSVEEQRGKKLVYGRKWRVEPELPSSEIIQTAFLAIKKAREHEVRELLRFQSSESGSVYTTPFNAHHDLPLMAQNSDLLRVDDSDHPDDIVIDQIKKSLEFLSYAGSTFSLKNFQPISINSWSICLTLEAIEKRIETIEQKNELADGQGEVIHFILERLSINEFYHQLMEALIRSSDRHVEENFTYKDFARFSRDVDITSLSELSSILRKRTEHRANEFEDNFSAENYHVDKSRAPKLSQSDLSQKIYRKLSNFGRLDGILPIDVM